MLWPPPVCSARAEDSHPRVRGSAQCWSLIVIGLVDCFFDVRENNASSSLTQFGDYSVAVRQEQLNESTRKEKWICKIQKHC